MARQHRIWGSFLGYSATIVAFAIACGSNDERPPVAPPGSGGTSGSGGTAGTSGTGGVEDSGTDGDAALDGSAGQAGSAGSSGGTAGADAGDGGNPDAAHCSNKAHDADESDVDCGGNDCPGCASGENCSGDSDCASKKCNQQLLTCNSPTCTDQVQNGNETDVDCGGANCDACADGKKCTFETDCKSGVCSGSGQMTCQVPSCTDTVKNGSESDVDCGGTCTQKCGLGKGCNGTGDCSSGNCTAKQCQCPTGMVIAPAAGGGAYCIDKYEVTYEDYTAFWNNNPVAKQAPECTSSNTTFTPPKNWPLPPGKTNKYPITNVDWCDAYAYCNWAGKRLCGKVGGGAAVYTSFADHTQDQWYNGCSAGANTYPYGSAFDKDLCIGANWSFSGFSVDTYPGTRTAPTFPAQFCQGASPGLFDMSGNVAEWENSCAGSGASDNCRIRGGSYLSPDADLACAANRSGARDATFDDVGFRCCYQ